MADKNFYGDNSSPVAKPLGERAMKQLDKSDMTADINGVQDSRATVEIDGATSNK